MMFEVLLISIIYNTFTPKGFRLNQLWFLPLATETAMVLDAAFLQESFYTWSLSLNTLLIIMFIMKFHYIQTFSLLENWLGQSVFRSRLLISYRKFSCIYKSTNKVRELMLQRLKQINYVEQILYNYSKYYHLNLLIMTEIQTT